MTSLATDRPPTPESSIPISVPLPMTIHSRCLAGYSPRETYPKVIIFPIKAEYLGLFPGAIPGAKDIPQCFKDSPRHALLKILRFDQLFLARV